MTGSSPDNLWWMRQLYLTYALPEFLSQAVRELECAGPTAFDLGGERGRLKQFRQLDSDGKNPTEFWQQAVTELNRFGILEFLEQLVPVLQGKLPTSRQLSEALRLPVKRRGRRHEL